MSDEIAAFTSSIPPTPPSPSSPPPPPAPPPAPAEPKIEYQVDLSPEAAAAAAASYWPDLPADPGPAPFSPEDLNAAIDNQNAIFGLSEPPPADSGATSAEDLNAAIESQNVIFGTDPDQEAARSRLQSEGSTPGAWAAALSLASSGKGPSPGGPFGVLNLPGDVESLTDSLRNPNDFRAALQGAEGLTDAATTGSWIAGASGATIAGSAASSYVPGLAGLAALTDGAGDIVDGFQGGGVEKVGQGSAKAVAGGVLLVGFSTGNPALITGGAAIYLGASVFEHRKKITGGIKSAFKKVF